MIAFQSKKLDYPKPTTIIHCYRGGNDTLCGVTIPSDGTWMIWEGDKDMVNCYKCKKIMKEEK